MRQLLAGAGPAGRGRGRPTWIGMLLGALVLTGCTSPEAPDDPVRILVLGDSLSQGRAGDWTWRYRLARHLDEVGADVDFVGPRRGVPLTAESRVTWPESSAYVDPGFDSDHAARWGQSASWLETPPDELVEQYRPDVVVLALGTNDLAFVERTPEETVDLLGRTVTNFRAVDEDVDVVAMDLPVAGQAGAPTTNALLAKRAAEWDTAESRVVVAPAARFYGPRTTWDGVHPDASGDWALARAVAQGLAEVGVGTPMAAPTTDDVAAAVREQVTAPTLTVSAGDGEVYLHWVETPWADRYRVWFRDVTAGQDRMTARSEVQGNAERVSGLADGHEYEFAVEPLRGLSEGGPDATSAPVRAVPTAAFPPPPVTPVASAAAGVASLTWPAVPGAVSYRVWFHRTDDPSTGWRTVDTAATALDVPGLVNGATYGFAVQSLTGGATTPAPGPEAAAVVAVGVPAAVPVEWRTTGVPGTVVFFWPEQPDVGWYEVALRNVTRGGPWKSSVSATFLPRPRVTVLDAVEGETYEFRLTPVNGVVRGPDAVVSLTVPGPEAPDL